MQETQAATTSLPFEVEGMSCASCAARVERVLARQPGVHRASVNFATAQAVVEMEPDLGDAELLEAAVRKIGYGLRQAQPSTEERRHEIEAVTFARQRRTTVWAAAAPESDSPFGAFRRCLIAVNASRTVSLPSLSRSAVWGVDRRSAARAWQRLVVRLAAAASRRAISAVRFL